MKYIFLLSFLLIGRNSHAQTDNNQLMAFPITDYITTLNDSVQIVQIIMPEGLSVKEKTVGLLVPKRTSGDTDSINIGFGRCQLIKNEYYYFAINIDKRSRLPKQGDLLYTNIDLPNVYNGILYKVAKHAITFSKIDETPLMTLNNVLKISTKKGEDQLVNSFVEEVHFTGKTMIGQSDNQDMIVESGVYKGQNLFATMLIIKDKDVTDFLEYIIARPALYAGHSWKFSETFATWMSAGAPTVIKE